MQSTKEKILLALTKYPYPKEFRVSNIAQDAFPDRWIHDTEGRQYNPMSATIARLLRNMDGVYEDKHRRGYFRYIKK